MFRWRKLVGLILVTVVGLFPSLALACAGVAMQSCHPCCANENARQLISDVNDSSPAAPCCAISSGKQAPRRESQVTSGTLIFARPQEVAARVESPTQRITLYAGRDSVPTQAPAQSALCTFLI